MPQPLPIAFCITELNPGGAERALVRLVLGLDRERFAPAVYSVGPRPAAGLDELAIELEAAGIETHFLGFSKSWQWPWALLKLWRLLAKSRPAIVQSFLFHANVLGTLAGWLAGSKARVTGLRVTEPRWWQNGVLRLVDPWVTRHVCVSNAVAGFVEKNLNLPPRKLVVIPNGVDVAKFADAVPLDLTTLGVPAGTRAILFVGRLDAQKGLGWLLHLASKLFVQFKHHDLLVVGHGPQRQLLETMVAELELEKWVRFVGYRTDVPRLMAASDVLVLPSQWEGMPNVLLEAMAAGKPVVATDVAGVREVLGPEANGQLVPPNDGAAFLAATAKLLENPDEAARIGGGNQARAQAEFGCPAMVARYVALYETLVQ